MSEIDLLPRADIPVLFNDFKCKADAVWSVVDSLVVTDVSQKEAMALARKTRLTLREIRIAVEHKRVELGEGHLTEIQKINGAAKAIREFIEPLEARLLVQESFAERVEADRIAALTKSRNAELESVRLGSSASNTGNLSQADYDVYIARLRAEKAELEESNRLRIEAERKLAEQAIELRRQEEAFLDNLQAVKAAENARLAAQRAEWAEQDRQRREEQVKVEAAARAEKDRLNEEAELARFEQGRKHREELQASLAIRAIERDAAEQRRQADLQIEREKTAKLEAELVQERAAKQAEVDAARKLAVAPDVEKLRDYYERLRGVKCPVPLATQEARECFEKVVVKFNDMASIINEFCQE